MFRPVIFGSTITAAYLTINSANAIVADHDTVDAAKKAAQALLNNANYKPALKDGYDIFILDIDKGTVASRARVEPSPLTWKDNT